MTVDDLCKDCIETDCRSENFRFKEMFPNAGEVEEKRDRIRYHIPECLRDPSENVGYIQRIINYFKR